MLQTQNRVATATSVESLPGDHPDMDFLTSPGVMDGVLVILFGVVSIILVLGYIMMRFFNYRKAKKSV